MYHQPINEIMLSTKNQCTWNTELPVFPTLDPAILTASASNDTSSFKCIKSSLKPRRLSISPNETPSSFEAPIENPEYGAGSAGDLALPFTQADFLWNNNRNSFSTPTRRRVYTPTTDSSEDDTSSLPLFPAIPSSRTLRRRGRIGAPPSVTLRPRRIYIARPTRHSPSGVDSIAMPF